MPKLANTHTPRITRYLEALDNFILFPKGVYSIGEIIKVMVDNGVMLEGDGEGSTTSALLKESPRWRWNGVKSKASRWACDGAEFPTVKAPPTVPLGDLAALHSKLDALHRETAELKAATKEMRRVTQDLVESGAAVLKLAQLAANNTSDLLRQLSEPVKS